MDSPIKRAVCRVKPQLKQGIQLNIGHLASDPYYTTTKVKTKINKIAVTPAIKVPRLCDIFPCLMLIPES
jgi:hypothetical protein